MAIHGNSILRLDEHCDLDMSSNTLYTSAPVYRTLCEGLAIIRNTERHHAYFAFRQTSTVRNLKRHSDHPSSSFPALFCIPTAPLLQPTPYNAPQVPARDTDEGGRRLNGSITSNDHDGELGDKDILPAYDASGGPPNYAE